MVTRAEAFPSDFDDEPLELEVAAHMGRIEHSILVDGKYEHFIDPHDFSNLLDAFFTDTDEPTHNQAVKEAQVFLGSEPVGRVISEALISLFETEDSKVLLRELYSVPEPDSKLYLYRQARIIDAAKSYLPDGYDAEVFRNPWQFEPPESEAA